MHIYLSMLPPLTCGDMSSDVFVAMADGVSMLEILLASRCAHFRAS